MTDPMRGFYGRGYTRWDEQADEAQYFAIRRERERQRRIDDTQHEVEDTINDETAQSVAVAFRQRPSVW